MNRIVLVTCFCLLSAGIHAADDLLLADFEQSDYQGWTPTGVAFGTAPAIR